jgi:hypothetical protein
MASNNANLPKGKKENHFMTSARFVLTILTALCTAPMALAHEFWIEPLKFQAKSGQIIVADLRNGELFAGNRQPFFESRNTRFEAVLGAQITPVTGRSGDIPAIGLAAPDTEGLMVLVHEAAPSTITYKEWAKFLSFAEHKDFTFAAALHAERGWAQENFKEIYTRHSKSLLAVGGGAGSDREMGLATEFVALDNPYDADFDGTLEVALLYDGAPRVDAQIEVYARDAADVVTVSILRTDAQGHAVVPVAPGMEYMLDAVVLREAAGATTAEAGPVWETLWASLTFAVPAR